ncbi:MAG: hypothetical protein Q8O04_04020 [Deltaproteobacteria bacterium]|nr:hypothetical protein [Deltaproteobacteria bacterium]
MVAKAKKETAAKAKVETAAEAKKPEAPAAEKKEGAGVTVKAKAMTEKRAKDLNISIEGLTLADAVRAIQRAEGNFDCFGTAIVYCDQDSCCWRFACLTIA